MYVLNLSVTMRTITRKASKAGFQYHPNWYSKAQKTKRIQKWCTNNPYHNHATIVHHLHYKRSLLRRVLGMFLLHNPFQVSISGYEIPGWDIVPVCEVCHDNHYGRSSSPISLHNGHLWVQRGGLGNYQVWWKACQLRFNFFILWVLGGCKG
jgi:hypothetical protein